MSEKIVSTIFAIGITLCSINPAFAAKERVNFSGYMQISGSTGMLVQYGENGDVEKELLFDARSAIGKKILAECEVEEECAVDAMVNNKKIIELYSVSYVEMQ